MTYKTPEQKQQQARERERIGIKCARMFERASHKLTYRDLVLWAYERYRINNIAFIGTVYCSHNGAPEGVTPNEHPITFYLRDRGYIKDMDLHVNARLAEPRILGYSTADPQYGANVIRIGDQRIINAMKRLRRVASSYGSGIYITAFINALADTDTRAYPVPKISTLIGSRSLSERVISTLRVLWGRLLLKLEI